MINITLPDSSVRQFESGTTGIGIALSISEGLARNVLAVKVDGEVWDATKPILKDAKIQLLTWNDTEGKATMWHSSAHLMAEAIEQLYAGRRLVACFEPRSNTTTRNIFQQELSECFDPAALVVIGRVHRPDRYPPSESLDTARLKDSLEKQGKMVFFADQNPGDYPQNIVAFLQRQIIEGDVVILLSNGSFSNLKNLLSETFQKKS